MKKVLVVEDETAIREFEVINLNRAGYTTVEAPNGEEALRLYAEEGDFDIRKGGRLEEMSVSL